MRLGTLTAAPPGRAAFRYAFTPADAVWLARLLAAAAGEGGLAQAPSLVWLVFRRYAFSAQRLGPMPFHQFLNQLAPSLPRARWRELPAGARALALAAVTGRLPSPPGRRRVYVHPGGQPVTAQSGPWRAPYRWGNQAELDESTTPSDATPRSNAGTDTGAPGVDDEPAMDAAPPGGGGMEPPEAVDEPDTGAGVAEPAAPAAPASPPPTFPTSDGNTLMLTPELLRALMGKLAKRPWRWWNRPRPGQAGVYPGTGRPPWWGGRPSWWTGRPSSWTRPGILPAIGQRPSGLRQPIVQRIGQLARGSQRIGTLRSPRTGRRFPVFGGWRGGKSYRIVTRPRGRLRHEIMLVRSGELEQEYGV